MLFRSMIGQRRFTHPLGLSHLSTRRNQVISNVQYLANNWHKTTARNLGRTFALPSSAAYMMMMLERSSRWRLPLPTLLGQANTEWRGYFQHLLCLQPDNLCYQSVERCHHQHRNPRRVSHHPNLSPLRLDLELFPTLQRSSRRALELFPTLQCPHYYHHTLELVPTLQ